MDKDISMRQINLGIYASRPNRIILHDNGFVLDPDNGTPDLHNTRCSRSNQVSVPTGWIGQEGRFRQRAASAPVLITARIHPFADSMPRTKLILQYVVRADAFGPETTLIAISSSAGGLIHALWMVPHWWVLGLTLTLTQELY